MDIFALASHMTSNIRNNSFVGKIENIGLAGPKHPNRGLPMVKFHKLGNWLQVAVLCALYIASIRVTIGMVRLHRVVHFLQPDGSIWGVNTP